ncbi:YjjG family noncanonical pyrimidine nucleotidase [Pseudoleptotrichia goodfellowii]|uniref:HAD hydrolase, TIGR02254 family n=1 Tax=Pseudoleptotrichia goodfellowii F0264 TaxID=596323 RepID=D0GJR0_9FUSO|nr:YjjG family noncanonical pyrimidine nucleotidase [Pseudoleptotrichia goodfellowii]EEY35603.1 HAD hydrolase, TIGR02254 family [Pseudoleptotrichia goodfellowii F0264]
MYKLIFIDADDTLFDFRKAQGNAMKKTFEDFDYFEKEGNEEKFDKIKEDYKVINSKLWRELEKGQIKEDELRVLRFERLFEKNSLKYNTKIFSEKYSERLSEGSFLLEGAEELCKYSSEKYRMIIITNGIKKVQIPRIKNSKINKYIEKIVVSEDTRVSKPNIEIFQYALDLANKKNKVTKQEIIMIGNSQSADIQGGINFGIDTCWINLKNQQKNEDIKAKYTVKSYKELYNFL